MLELSQKENHENVIQDAGNKRQELLDQIENQK